jgi:membrane protein YqaA with SNARE-associated domain
MKILRALYDWMGSRVTSRYADTWLMFLFFIESSLFIVPVDPMLILFCIHNRMRSWYYAGIATIASVIGGLFGYILGWGVWDLIGKQLVGLLISQDVFTKMLAYYHKHEALAVLIGGLTPIPYKAVTISAGFCQLPLVPFICYSLIARGLRFFLIAGAIYYFGERIKAYIDRYFNYLVCLFTVVVVLGFYSIL